MALFPGCALRKTGFFKGVAATERLERHAGGPPRSSPQSKARSFLAGDALRVSETSDFVSPTGEMEWKNRCLDL
ncbi:hypothetical protein AOLI_G00269260 [Acnodon oligacanthus]